MRILPLGVGGAFTQRFYHANYIIELEKEKFLLDAGTTLRYSLKAARMIETDIDGIFLTHFHSDHVGGLEEFLQRSHYLYRYHPSLYVQPDQLVLLTQLLALGGVKPDFYAKVNVVKDTLMHRINEETLCTVSFISTTGLHSQVTSNYMLTFTESRTGCVNKRVVFTGDIGTIERTPLYDLVCSPETAAIFHDCHTASTPTDAHPSLNTILTYYPELYRHKIYLTHYGDNIAERQAEIIAAGFHLAEQGTYITI